MGPRTQGDRRISNECDMNVSQLRPLLASMHLYAQACTHVGGTISSPPRGLVDRMGPLSYRIFCQPARNLRSCPSPFKHPASNPLGPNAFGPVRLRPGLPPPTALPPKACHKAWLGSVEPRKLLPGPAAAADGPCGITVRAASAAGTVALPNCSIFLSDLC